MKTIYYSEVLKKEFDSAEACEAAEKQYYAEQIQQANNQQDKKQQDKKQFADAVELADKKVVDAYQKLNMAKKKVRELYESSDKEIAELIEKRNEEMKAILEPAKRIVKEAKEARRKALSEYNKHYGVYERCYTGSNAIEELLKDLSETPLAFLADIMRGTARTAGTNR